MAKFAQVIPRGVPAINQWETTVPTPVSGKLELRPRDIHLWITHPSQIRDAGLLARYADLLTGEETQKQQRYMFEKDRHDALVTRAFVRDLLSAYATIEPADWRMDIGPKGKPELLNPPIPLRFNLSHTRGLIICAVTLKDDIGCDVEAVGRSSDILSIADHYFSAREVEELFSLPEQAQRSRFFDYWTLKESYIKACGLGLFAIPLADFSFHIGCAASAVMNDNVKLSFAPGIDDDPALWTSWIYYPSDDHRIALSTKRSPQHATNDKQPPSYTIRLFESVPLLSRHELDCNFSAAE
jgi:4'-phosphopantetheinyl transferase